MATGSPGRWGIAPGVRLFALVLPLALAVAVGCSAPGGRRAPPESLLSRVWLNHGHANDYHDADASAVNGLARAMEGEPTIRTAQTPLNVLCVSAGGKFAAFTSGALAGWTRSGTRPAFDVATGVSSGSPVALMAFLGPKYDPVLAEIVFDLNRSDLYSWRPVRGLITGTGLMSSQPLADLLERQIDEEVLADLCSAHVEGRRMFVATSNVQSHRLVIWDVGAIASSGRPDALQLVRKVILAACSIPGLVPAVEFDVTVNGQRYTELHADAGNLAQMFVRTSGPLPPGSSVWILSAGKTHPNVSAAPPGVLGSMFSAVSTGLYALFRADTVKLYALCGVTRSNFRMMALPRDFSCRANSMMFDPAESRRMYWLGYQMALGGAWESRPPDTATDELCPPRAGTEFVTK